MGEGQKRTRTDDEPGAGTVAVAAVSRRGDDEWSLSSAMMEDSVSRRILLPMAAQRGGGYRVFRKTVVSSSWRPSVDMTGGSPLDRID